MRPSIPTTPAKIVRRGSGHGPTLSLLAAAIAVALALLLFREPAWKPGVEPGDRPDTKSASVVLTDAVVHDGFQPLDLTASNPPGASSPARRDSAYREPAKAPANEPAVLVLTVVDMNGPVEGAHVSFGDRLLTEGSEPAASVTDADGRLTLEVWPRRSDSIHVSRRGSRWSQVFVWRSPRAGVEVEHQVRLHTSERSTKLEVRSFPSNQPIVGAVISIGARSAMLVHGDPRRAEAAASTNERIPIVIPTSRPNTRDPFKVTVTADGHTTAEFTQGDAEPPSRTIELIKHARLSGRLAFNVVASGAPANGSYHLNRVSPKELDAAYRNGVRSVYLVPSDAVEPRAGGESTRAFTGVSFDPRLSIANGLITWENDWAIESLEFESKTDRHDHLLLLATADGYSRVVATDVSVGPGDELTIEDELLHGEYPPLTLRFSYGDGRPLTGVPSVLLERVTDVDDQRLTVDASIGDSGQTSQLPLPAGSWRWSFRDSPLPTLTEGEIRHEGGVPHQVRIDGITSIEGRIAGRDREAADLVHWQRWDPDAEGSVDGAWLTQTSIRSEPDGRFMLPLVPAGGMIRLVAERTTSATRFGVTVTAFDVPEAVTVRLPGGAAPWTGTTLKLPKLDQSTSTLTPGVK